MELATSGEDQLITQTRSLSVASSTTAAASPSSSLTHPTSPGPAATVDTTASASPPATLDMDMASATITTTAAPTPASPDRPMGPSPGPSRGAKTLYTAADARPPLPPRVRFVAGRDEGNAWLDMARNHGDAPALEDLPFEILFHIFDFLEVSDLLSASRTSHLLRSVSLTPLLHVYRLHRTRFLLPPLLWARPPLSELISRSIFRPHTSVVSRRLARSLVSIRLTRLLAARPSAEALVARAVLPKECVPGMSPVYMSPALVQRKQAVERQRIKDGLRRWIEGKWQGEVREREERVRRGHESRGVGRVWRLKRFWERVGKGEDLVAR